jgi:hypothetical protein
MLIINRLWLILLQALSVCSSQLKVSEQIHTYNTRNNKDYYKYVHNLELYNSVGNPPHRNNRRIVESRVFFGVRPQAITGKARQDIYSLHSLQSLQGWSLSLESALALVAKRGHGNAPRATVAKRGHDTTRHIGDPDVMSSFVMAAPVALASNSSW